MKPSEPFQPATPIQHDDPSFPPFDALLENNQTPPHLVVPQIQRSTWSTLSPPPVNPSPQSQLYIDLQERPDTVTIAPHIHNHQSIIFTDSSPTTQPTPKTIYPQTPIFSTPTSLDTTRTP